MPRDDAKDLKKLLWAVVIGLAVLSGISGVDAYESHQANLHAANAEKIVAGRDFNKLYDEHGTSHREHDEIKALLCSLPEVQARPELKEMCAK